MTGQDRRLSGKVAFISGIAGGQGRMAALIFAREGARVFGCDVDADGATATVHTVREAGGEIESVHPLDLTADDAPASWVQAGIDRFGRIDVLYNNAATARFAGIGQPHAREAWRYTLRGELDIVYETLDAAWPHLIASEGSSVINISSAAALGGRPIGIDRPGSSAAHAATKAGVLGLTRQAAAEGAPHRIRVNAILPGFVEAPVTASALATERARRTISSLNPLGRYGQPEDIVYAAVYLASDESSWVTGETIVVDGGMTHARGGYGEIS